MRHDRNRSVRTVDDVMDLLDGLFAPEANRWTEDASDWWDDFYADRDRSVPFFVSKPDENLAAHLDGGVFRPGRGAEALDLGCGPGRNALRLAAAGYEVDAVDLSPKAIAWAEERAREAGPDICSRTSFTCGDAFALTRAHAELSGPYEVIHDSGCFHHLPPHRRVGYLALLDRLLAPGGHFSLTCFAAGEGGMGSEIPDADLYRADRPHLHGGLAYSPESLRRVFATVPGLEEVEIRRMRDEPADSPHFGESFLWTALFRRAHG